MYHLAGSSVPLGPTDHIKFMYRASNPPRHAEFISAPHHTGTSCMWGPEINSG